MPLDHFKMANFSGMNLKKVYGAQWKENGRKYPVIF